MNSFFQASHSPSIPPRKLKALIDGLASFIVQFYVTTLLTRVGSSGMNLFVLILYPLIPLEAVTIADRSLDFFIEPLHLGQVFVVDIEGYFGLDCIKRFHKMKKALSIKVMTT